VSAKLDSSDVLAREGVEQGYLLDYSFRVPGKLPRVKDELQRFELWKMGRNWLGERWILFISGLLLSSRVAYLEYEVSGVRK